MARGVKAYNDTMITVALVPPGTLHLGRGLVAGSSRGRRRRTTRRRAGHGQRRGPPPAPLATMELATVEVASSALRECIPDFGCSMISGTSTWTRSMSAILARTTTFQLEVQTEMKVYEDCFARMHSLYRPIPGVAFCIELLKVATQIGFVAVVEIGIKYLAVSPWSEEDVALVCEFCRVPSLEPDEPENDLTRNREQWAQCVMHLLSAFVQHIIPTGRKPVPQAGRKFAEAFQAVVSGGVCVPVVACATNLVKDEAKRLLGEISDFATEVYAGLGAIALSALDRFAWLFNAVHGSEAEQALAEFLVDEDVLCDLHKGYRMAETYITLTAVKEWARMLFRIVEDVMEGKLVLSTAQRASLNRKGRWLLVSKYLTQSEEEIADMVTLFLLTLPEKNCGEPWLKGLFRGHWGGTYAMWLSMSSEY